MTDRSWLRFGISVPKYTFIVCSGVVVLGEVVDKIPRVTYPESLLSITVVVYPLLQLQNRHQLKIGCHLQIESYGARWRVSEKFGS